MHIQWCNLTLARCSFRLFPNFRWDALWGIYIDVILPYLKWNFAFRFWAAVVSGSWQKPHTL
jgi:hypothetical protein